MKRKRPLSEIYLMTITKNLNNLKKRFFTYLILFLCITLILCLSAEQTHALSIKKTTHTSGLTILNVERHALPIVAINLLIKASPLNEEKQKAGTANLTAKLLKEGTTKRKSLEIAEEIEFIGASLDTSVSRDYSTISLTVLKKDLERGFEIFSDILQNPLFSEDEIVRKKELIKGSLRQREEDPSFVVNRVFINEIFADHPYGRLLEGSLETLDNIKRDDIVRFYNVNYLPTNSILSVVGDITEGELHSLINKYLKDWLLRDSNIESKKIHSSHAPQQLNSSIKIIERDITQANIVFGHKGISRDNPDYYDVIVMNYILGGGGFASRLMKVVRDQMGLTYSIHSSFSANKEPGEFSVEVQTKNESAHIVVKEILRQIKRIRTELVSDQEIDDAKAFLIGSFPRRLETSRKIADFLSVVTFYNLGDDFIKKYPDYINKVTKESIQKAALKYLHTDNYILVIAGNKGKIDLSDFKNSE